MTGTMSDIASLQAAWDDILEEMHGIDGMIEGLQRQGVGDGPRVALLKRRRRYCQERLREIEAVIESWR